MPNRIYVFPWDQLSEGATAVAAALNTQKLLRKGSRYKPQPGDVIVNWGASDFPEWAYRFVGDKPDNGVKMLNFDTSVTIDKRVFFNRCEGMFGVPKAITIKRQPDRVGMAKSMIAAAGMTYPILCRVKVKGKDGEGIVIANSPAELVDAPLYVQLEAKTSEYRVHMGRNRDGSTSIIGVQQKFLPRGTKKEDCILRTSSAGCYFVWTKDGQPIDLPPPAEAACREVFDRFPELIFGGLDVIYDAGRSRAFVVEINSAPEMTEKAAELYAGFFQQFRQPVVEEIELEEPAEAPDAAWLNPQPEPEPVVADAALDQPLGRLETKAEYVCRNAEMAAKLLEAAGVVRHFLAPDAVVAHRKMVFDPARIDVV